jgi:hypothetical protein
MARRLLLAKAMSVYSPQYHTMVSSPGSARAESVTSMATADTGAKEGVKEEEGFFGHLLDVVNPLQHLPIIGTIYRAITGDKMGPIEKIAGDTLYGGMWGAIASIADVAFESITGKSFEDTALALFKGDGKSKATKVAATPISISTSLPSADVPLLPASANVPGGLDVAAFTNALSAKGVDGDTASRALYAYRRSMGLIGIGKQPVLAGVH